MCRSSFQTLVKYNLIDTQQNITKKMYFMFYVNGRDSKYFRFQKLFNSAVIVQKYPQTVNERGCVSIKLYKTLKIECHIISRIRKIILLLIFFDHLKM